MSPARSSARSYHLFAEHFGAESLVFVNDVVASSRVELARRRIAVTASVGGCGRCERRANGEPIPVQTRTPAQPVDFAVITDNPLDGPDATVPRRVLVGALDKARVNPDRVAWIAVNACPSGRLGPATLDQQSACHQNLLEQIAASEAQYLLLAGAKAKSSWRYDLGLPKVAGRLGVWDIGGRDTRYVYPVLGPADLLYAGSRGDKTLIREWENQIIRFAQMVSNDIGTLGLSESCTNCGDYMTLYDADGMAWCGRHADKGLEGARKSRTKWAVDNHPTLL